MGNRNHGGHHKGKKIQKQGICLRSLLLYLRIYRSNPRNVPAGPPQGAVFPVSGLRGNCNRRGMVYRKASGEDETEKVVGLFRQEVEFCRIYLSAIFHSMGTFRFSERSVFKRMGIGCLSYPARCSGKSNCLDAYGCQSHRYFRFPDGGLSSGKKAAFSAGVEPPSAGMDSGNYGEAYGADRGSYAKGLSGNCERAGSRGSKGRGKMRNRPAFLAVFYWSLSGRYCGNHFLPDYGGSLDEQKQSGMGAFQYCLGAGDCTFHGPSF